MVCPVCKSGDVQTLVHQNQCLSCGSILDASGKLSQAGDDQSTIDAITSRLGPREHNVVGNLADLQRLGAEVVSPGKTKVDDAFETPRGADPDRMPKGNGKPAAAAQSEPETVDTAKKAEADRSKAEAKALAGK